MPSLFAFFSPLMRANPAQRIVAAMATVVVAGAVQEASLQLGHPDYGIFFVLPAALLTAILWRPDLAVVAIVVIYVGLELVLPIQTGGGRYEDWILHYEISRRFAGLANVATGYALAGRTPLFHELIGAFLPRAPQYWVFAIGAVILNALWIWPATLLLRLWSDRPRIDVTIRLLTIAVSPFILSYAAYTWPWGFATFFLLAALYLADQSDRLSAVGVGLGLTAALLTHPGMLGYVVGAAAFVVVRHRDRVISALLAGGVALATALPWVLDVTNGRGLSAMVSGSVPARQAVSLPLYLFTRVMVWVTSIIPLIPGGTDKVLAQWLVAVFVATIPGALLAASLVARRWMRPTGAAGWAIAAGIAIGWLIYPPNNSTVGMLDALYPAVVLILTITAARAPDREVRILLVVQTALAVVFFALLMWVSVLASADDPNLLLKTRLGARFLSDDLGYLPGAAVALTGLAVLVGGMIGVKSVAPPAKPAS